MKQGCSSAPAVASQSLAKANFAPAGTPPPDLCFFGDGDDSDEGGLLMAVDSINSSSQEEDLSARW